MCQKPYIMAGPLRGSGNGIRSPDIVDTLTGYPGAGENLSDQGRRELPDLPGPQFS